MCIDIYMYRYRYIININMCVYIYLKERMHWRRWGQGINKRTSFVIYVCVYVCMC